MYDAIVIGARCGGAPTAMLLARKGYKVLLVDRATFPSDIPHGHLIHRHGPRLLHRWGVLDRVVASGCPPITTRVSDAGDYALVATDVTADGIGFAYGPRRYALDTILVEPAVAAGIEFRDGFAVEEFVNDGERVTGIRGRQVAGGGTVTEHARVTVGADGRHSRLARAVQAPVYEAVPTLMCWYFSYWSDTDACALETYVRGRRALFTHPTHDGLRCLLVAWPIAEQRAVQADLEAQFMAAVDLVPELAERIRNGRREERFYGATNLPNFLRKPYGPGWALVGDASCYKDPYLALGVCDAFRDADLLVEALDAGFSGRHPLDEALAGYEQRRNVATLPDCRRNLALARFAPLRGDAEARRRYIMASEGMIARETFYNPENLQRLLAYAPSSSRAMDQNHAEVA